MLLNKRSEQLNSICSLTTNEDDAIPRRTEVVWCHKRYIPTDLRSTAPVPRHKFLNPRILTCDTTGWEKLVDPPMQFYMRCSSPRHAGIVEHDKESGRKCYFSAPSSRCEEWSTLREMLPSIGFQQKKPSPPPWGVSHAAPNLKYKTKPDTNLPMINSEMTSYIDTMHVADRLFRLY